MKFGRKIAGKPDKAAMGKRARELAIDKIVTIVMRLRKDIDIEALLRKAQDRVEYERALRASWEAWPILNKERYDGSIVGVPAGSPPLKWDEHIRWDAKYGEWDADRWGYPPEPKFERGRLVESDKRP